MLPYVIVPCITRVFWEVPCTSSITQGPSASLFGFHHTSVLV
jgi:hypothetical protein